MADQTVVTNAQVTKPKYMFLLHLLTGCLIFYGLMINTSPPIHQDAKMENTQSFFTETVGFSEAETFNNIIETPKKYQFFNFYIPAPYIGKSAEKYQHKTTKN